MENPDLDILYDLQDELEEYTHNAICDNGYDYLTNTKIGIWLAARSAKENLGMLIEFISSHEICGNDLSQTAQIYISDKETAEIEEATLVYDGVLGGEIN